MKPPSIRLGTSQIPTRPPQVLVPTSGPIPRAQGQQQVHFGTPWDEESPAILIPTELWVNLGESPRLCGLQRTNATRRVWAPSIVSSRMRETPEATERSFRSVPRGAHGSRRGVVKKALKRV